MFLFTFFDNPKPTPAVSYVFERYYISPKTTSSLSPQFVTLSKQAQETLGHIGVERFNEFSRYQKGWKDGYELGEPLSYDSVQTMEHFFARFENFGKFLPSLFFSTSGNLQLAWKTLCGNVIELEFLSNGIAALLPNDDEPRFFPNEQLDRLVEALKSVP